MFSCSWYYKCNKTCTRNSTWYTRCLIVRWYGLDVVIENRIREFRKEMGLSQSKLAQMVGLKRRSIMAYEANTISPTLEKAYKICKVFDKDIKEVFIFK